MTDDDAFELSRRKALAGLGTIGVASAGAGLGTSAFFSDTEEFTGNRLAAGSLDLKVDWEEHYSDWSDDEANLDDDDGSNDLDVQMSDQGSGYTPLPDPQNPLIWVANGDLDAFMDNTAVEAYPDTNDDGIQDPFNDTTNGVTVGDFCTDGADTAEDLDPNGGTGLRTNKVAGEVPPGEATVTDSDEVLPLVNVEDVKPGDFGEVTFSLHLCDNDGYVWLNGRPVTAAENGHAGPEAEDDDEEGGADESYDVNNGDDISDVLTSEVELLDAIQTTFWYDDGDNVIGTDGGVGGQADPLCVQLVLDASGSMSGPKNTNTIEGAKFLAGELLNGSTSNRVGVTFFSASGYSQGAQVQVGAGTSDAQDLSAVEAAIEGLPADGSDTAVGAGMDTAATDLENCPDNARRIMVVLSNGGENVEPQQNVIDRADDYCDNGFEINTIAVGANAAEQFLEDVACSPDMAFTSPDPANIEGVFEQVTGGIQEIEEVFFRGSLRDALTELSDGLGIPLDGDRGTAFDEINDPADSDARECFEASNDHYIGLAWYLPVDHANEIQTDSVSFDLGFYTEQCRHNDGAGQTPAGQTT